MKEEEITGVRVSKQTKKRLKNLHHKFCEYGDDMDTLLNRICILCEKMSVEEIKAVVK